MNTENQESMHRIQTKNKFSYIPKILALLAFVIFLTQCSESQPKIELHSKPFQFDPQEVKAITITKFDPKTGENWITSMKKENKSWEISTPPDDHPILDRKADGIFIHHLLDSLRTMKMESRAPNGPLASFELDPPRFGIRWNTSNHEFELRVGAQIDKSKGHYFSMDASEVFIGNGSAFQLIEQIHSFEKLRMQSWTSLSADDIDEIELVKNGKKLLYAQRDGEHWADKSHRPFDSDLNSLLSKLTAGNPIQFIDEIEETKKLQNYMNSDMIYQISLKGRKSQSDWIKLLKKDGKLYGINSSRPKTVFVLHPDLLQRLDSVK